MGRQDVLEEGDAQADKEDSVTLCCCLSKLFKISFMCKKQGVIKT